MTDIIPDNARRLTGRCLCGAVSYAVTDAFEYAANCHCIDCQRATGSAFKPFAGIEMDMFEVTNGVEHLLVFGEELADDARCAKCGSLFYTIVRTYVHVTLGTLTDDPTIRPTAHIFVRSKAPWFTIADDLPQYLGHVADGLPVT